MRWITLLLFVPLIGCHRGESGGPAATGKPTEIKAEGGTTVHTELVKSKVGAKGVVLMFHQAGSNLHEYDPIAARVASLGWDCLKVDQRSGGEMWGATNKTAAQFTGDTHYWDAYADLESALKWAEGKGYKKVITWGSSYSASLVLLLASEHKSVNAVVSFSPGEYFDQEGIVAKWNSKVTVPCFFGATSEELITEVYKLVDTKPKSEGRDMDVVFGTKDGVHGSSALREDKNPADYLAYWEHLERFLRSFESGGKNFGG
jgi:dienelactone hydrolase